MDQRHRRAGSDPSNSQAKLATQKPPSNLSFSNHHRSLTLRVRSAYSASLHCSSEIRKALPIDVRQGVHPNRQRVYTSAAQGCTPQVSKGVHPKHLRVYTPTVLGCTPHSRWGTHPYELVPLPHKNSSITESPPIAANQRFNNDNSAN